MSDERTTHGENSIHIKDSTVHGHVVGGRDNTLNVHNYPKPEFPIHYLPPHNPNFTGREAQLAQLHTALSQQEATVAITQTIAGLGGVGKTQLALAYAHQHKGAYELAWWLDGSDGLTIDLGLQTLGRRLNLPLPADDFAAMRQIVLSAVNSMAQRWLLIYDNVDSLPPHELYPYLPSGNGAVLITSRNPDWSDMSDVLSLSVFSPEESEAFWVGRLGEAVAEREVRAKLASELGHLPLALEHAAAYIKANGIGVADYLRLFSTRREALWTKAKPSHAYKETITTTWNLAFDEARKKAGTAELLNLFCFLDGEGIPLDLLREYANHLPPELSACVGDELALNGAVEELRRYSLVARQGETVSMHRLVQAVGRDQMGAERRVEWLAAAVDWLSGAYRFDQHDMGTWPAAGRLLPHLQVAVAEAECLGVENEQVGFINNYIGFQLHQYGQSQKAIGYMIRALAICEKVLGAEHLATAAILSNIGGLWESLGQLGESRFYIERALTIYENELLIAESLDKVVETVDINYLGIAASLNNMGALLESMGQLVQARSYYERALTICEKVLGADNPYTVTSLNNLGGLLHAMGELPEAWSYYDCSLAISEKVLGVEHPSTATSLNNIGGILQDIGELEEAQIYYERALAIREKVLGTEHPDTVDSLNNMGGILQERGEWVEAQSYYERALAIRKKVLGVEHPDTAVSINNIGGLFQEIGEWAEARSYYEYALIVWEKTLGAEHPNIATGLNNLAWLCHDEGNYPEAARLMRQALAIVEKSLGANHPNTQTARQGLAAIEAKLSFRTK